VPRFTRRERLTLLFCLLAPLAAALIATTAAAASWPREAGFRATYPGAVRLCAAPAAGQATTQPAAGQTTTPPAPTTEIAAACAQLRSAFAAARASFVTTTAPLRRQARTAINQYVQICRQDRLNHDRAACLPARQAALATLKALRTKFKAAVRSYRAAVTKARQAFWAAIGAGPAGSTEPAYSAVIPVPPSPIPPNSSVPSG
jgi:hypothetical protein